MPLFTSIAINSISNNTMSLIDYLVSLGCLALNCINPLVSVTCYSNKFNMSIILSPLFKYMGRLPENFKSILSL